MRIRIGKEENAVIEVSGQNVYKYINNTYACENAITILKNLQELEEISPASKRDNYVIKSHNLEKFILPVKEENFRLEEWTCKNMVFHYPTVDKNNSYFGRLVGYQIPLKAAEQTDRSKNEGLGKIDILAVNDDTAFILELKIKDSTEHPLRAVLEAYTYWKLLGGNDAQEFLTKSDANEAKKLEKAVIFYKNSRIHNKLNNNKYMNHEAIELIKKLEVRCFLVEESKQNNDMEQSSLEQRITFTDVNEYSWIDIV